jgi:hypothetical protein
VDSEPLKGVARRPGTRCVKRRGGARRFASIMNFLSRNFDDGGTETGGQSFKRTTHIPLRQVYM